MDLTSKQRAQLRGLANTIDTIVQVGKDGITENVIAQVNEALEARELIKGRVLDNNIEYDARLAAEELAKEGISAEVIDPRTLVPFDYDTVVNSVKKTGRLVVVHEAHQNCGWGAQVIAEVSKQAFRYLDASPIHIGAKACPLPFNPGLEAAVIPSVKEIVDACKATMYR